MTTPTSTHPDQLPAPVLGYLAAHEARDVAAAFPACTPTAVVVDDGATHRGTDEIRGFLSKAGNAVHVHHHARRRAVDPDGVVYRVAGAILRSLAVCTAWSRPHPSSW